MTEIQTKTKGRKRVIIAAGALLGIAALATSAAFTDFANLNFGAKGIGGGGGDPENPTYNIQVADFDEDGIPITTGAGVVDGFKWQEADTPEGSNVPMPGANSITPGEKVTVEIPFRNQSAELTADTYLQIKNVEPSGAAQATDAEMLDNLLFKITLHPAGGGADVVRADGLSLKALNDASTKMVMGELESKDVASITVEITLKDQGSADLNNAFKDLVAYPQAQFTSTSMQP